jgi:hypothetical protein
MSFLRQLRYFFKVIEGSTNTMDLQVAGYGGTDWNELAQDRVGGRHL